MTSPANPSPIHERFAELLRECPMIAILRGITPAETGGICDALHRAGVRLLEIPLNSPDACESIRIAAEKTAGRMLVGAGTVLTEDEAARVADAGGTFVISPNVDVGVIRATKSMGLVSIPGFFSPTEAFAALGAGADYLKLFPAGRLGVGYVRDIQAVVKAPIFAVGGVDVGNIGEFLRCCAGAGIGGALYRPGRSAEDIAMEAQRFLKAMAAMS